MLFAFPCVGHRTQARSSAGADRQRLRDFQGDPESLTLDEPFDHLFGITIFNDFSARDVQALEMPIGMGSQKSKDFAYGIGPWVATMDEIGSIEGLKGQVRINGEVLSDTKVEDFVLPRPSCSHVSIADRLQLETSLDPAPWASAPASRSDGSCSPAISSNSSSKAWAHCAHLYPWNVKSIMVAGGAPVPS
nr:fumarylacetoacetate hydrolase family protein [Arthrobacter sp. ISL-30]